MTSDTLKAYATNRTHGLGKIQGEWAKKDKWTALYFTMFDIVHRTELVLIIIIVDYYLVYRN